MTIPVGKKDWANVDWLLAHYWAKSGNRLRQMAALPVRAGEKVLDVGCGPGLYTSHVSDLVGPTGIVVGIDVQESSVEYANNLLSQRGCKHASAVVSTLEAHLGEIERYDVVMFMNSLGYFENPEQVIRSVGTALRPGSRIVVKDYDLESVFLAPIDREQLFTLMSAAIAGNESSNPLAFNNFFGRQVPFLGSAFAFRSIENLTWTQLMTHPFSKEQRRYVRENIVSLIDQARGRCSDDVIEYHENEFVREGGKFFDRAHAMFTENEYVSMMTK